MSLRSITLTDVIKRNATSIGELETVLHRVPGVRLATDAPMVHEDPNYGERDGGLLRKTLLPGIVIINLCGRLRVLGACVCQQLILHVQHHRHGHVTQLKVPPAEMLHKVALRAIFSILRTETRRLWWEGNVR